MFKLAILALYDTLLPTSRPPTVGDDVSRIGRECLLNKGLEPAKAPQRTYIATLSTIFQFASSPPSIPVSDHTTQRLQEIAPWHG